MNTPTLASHTPDAPLRGAELVALVPLTDKAGSLLAAPGETCAQVPSGSLAWLLADGWIRPATLGTPDAVKDGDA